MSNRVARRALVLVVLLTAGSWLAFARSASEERSVAEFSKLVVRDGIDVFLTQSGSERLRVEVDGAELEDVLTEVEGDVLMLSRRGGWRDRLFGPSRVDVHLDFVQLSSIEASSGSDIQGRGPLRVDELSVEAAGGSDVELDLTAKRVEFSLAGGSDLMLRGSAPWLGIEAAGGSDVSARAFEAERARLVLHGGSDAVVHVTAAIDVEAHGGSDVTTYGDPPEKSLDNDRSSDLVWR